MALGERSKITFSLKVTILPKTIIGCNFVSDLLNKTLISYNGLWFTCPFMYL